MHTFILWKLIHALVNFYNKNIHDYVYIYETMHLKYLYCFFQEFPLP